MVVLINNNLQSKDSSLCLKIKSLCSALELGMTVNVLEVIVMATLYFIPVTVIEVDLENERKNLHA